MTFAPKGGGSSTPGSIHHVIVCYRCRGRPLPEPQRPWLTLGAPWRRLLDSTQRISESRLRFSPLNTRGYALGLTVSSTLYSRFWLTRRVPEPGVDLTSSASRHRHVHRKRIRNLHAPDLGERIKLQHAGDELPTCTPQANPTARTPLSFFYPPKPVKFGVSKCSYNAWLRCLERSHPTSRHQSPGEKGGGAESTRLNPFYIQNYTPIQFQQLKPQHRLSMTVPLTLCVLFHFPGKILCHSFKWCYQRLRTSERKYV